jgi:hypothetical protein
MTPMPTLGPALLHTVGFLTGAILYGMLLAMVLRTRAAPDRLALATAAMGLCWNVGELLAQGTRAMHWDPTSAWLGAAAYSALGLLAAVVIHSVARVRGDELWSMRCLSHAVGALGYGSAVIAGIIHLRAAALGERLPSPLGLDVMTAGLIALTIPLITVTRRQHHSRRALWSGALAAFAISALHLGRFHGADESWAIELLGHHASIPLAFAMLYHDYRFALADLFLKRALTLLALVAVVVAGYSLVAPHLTATSPMAVAALLGVWLATVLMFPTLRSAINRFVDRAVLSRADYEQVLEELNGVLQKGDVEAVLAGSCDTLGLALGAATVSCIQRTSTERMTPSEVVIHTAEAPYFVLVVGPLAGGRRLLSDDIRLLQHAALLLARRIDALRLTSERYERMLHEREMRSLATEAELRALRAQINPHFLFNALTTIGYLIQSAPKRGFDTLMLLTTLLRSVLRSEGEFTTLGRERELIESYLQIERERFEERLTVEIDIPKSLDRLTLPSLIVQPLIENAIKHGIAKNRAGGSVRLTAAILRSGESDELCISVRNTGAPLKSLQSSDGGVGLANVERRLECYYGASAGLRVRRTADGATLAELRLPLTSAGADDEAEHAAVRRV